MALRGDEINIAGPKQLVSSRTNKISHSTTGQNDGIEGELENELALDLTDKELLVLATKWLDSYQGYAGRVLERQKVNKQYYLGKQNQTQYSAVDGAPVAANRIFSATETFLAAALARDPEPLVYSDNTEQGNEESRLIKTMLQSLADGLELRSKLALMTRHWNIYFIGIIKHGWNESLQEIESEVRSPKNFLFDPNGYVDVYGDFVGWIGEKITVSAQKLADTFSEHEQFIKEVVEYQMGTEVTYTEWWTDDYTFSTFKGRVLDKARNPHFNYPKNVPEKKGELVRAVLKKGDNHFAMPKKPYTCLSVFSLQEQPHDETSLIEQNIPNQDILTRRVQQINKNFNHANNAIVFSADRMDQQKAKQAADGIDKGHPVLVNGNVNEAVMRFPAPSFPQAAFEEVRDTERRIDETYGVQGLSAVAQTSDTTARGMILNQQRDATRIGGGIGDKLEGVSKATYNYWYQMMKVYYTDPHVASYIGAAKAVELATLDIEDITRKLTISVVNGSMVPKDELSEANQAMQLAEAGMLDPKTLMRLQNVPAPDETAENTVLWNLNKQLYIVKNFPELAQLMQLQAPQAPQGGAPPQPQGMVSPIQSQAPITQPEQPASLSAVPLPS